MMNCEQATRLLSDAQERELSLKERASLKIHVLMCSGCNNFSRQMQLLHDFSRVYIRSDGEVSTKQGRDSNALDEGK